MARKTHHVVPNPGGGWDVKAGGASRASRHFDTKAPAESYGRGVSQRAGSEFLVHGHDGKIQRSDSHGGDPMPPRDSR
ncbi:MAG TPA: DUF2188 domain-containing protein [Rhodothermales bacterium]|nr:DUF2188 domain-containing protein [Rhodothermales bacterium]